MLKVKSVNANGIVDDTSRAKVISPVELLILNMEYVSSPADEIKALDL